MTKMIDLDSLSQLKKLSNKDILISLVGTVNNICEEDLAEIKRRLDTGNGIFRAYGTRLTALETHCSTRMKEVDKTIQDMKDDLKPSRTQKARYMARDISLTSALVVAILKIAGIIP